MSGQYVRSRQSWGRGRRHFDVSRTTSKRST
jgi:hypothetical protein